MALEVCDSELEKAEFRADVVETKITELEEELRVVANNLKSLEVAEEEANRRETTYRSDFAEKSVEKLQREVDHLEDGLVIEQSCNRGA